MQRLDKILSSFEKAIMVITLLCMLLFILIATACRFLELASITWGEEAARFLMIWMAMISLGHGFKTDSHLGISFIVDLLPEKIRKYFIWLRIVLILIFCLIVVYYGAQIVIRQFGNRQTSPTLHLPMFFVYMSIPVGYLLAFVRFSMKLVADRRNQKRETEAQG